MADIYTPLPHEARGRFVTGSIEVTQRRYKCSPEEAERIAHRQFDAWVAALRAEWEAEVLAVSVVPVEQGDDDADR